MRTLPGKTGIDRLDLVFFALADATRRSLIEQLRKGETTVSQLAAPHAMSLPAVSKHLRLLEEAGLLSRRISGRTHFISANPEPLSQASTWIERQRQFWESSFDQLAAYLETPEETSSNPPNTTTNPNPAS